MKKPTVLLIAIMSVPLLIGSSLVGLLLGVLLLFSALAKLLEHQENEQRRRPKGHSKSYTVMLSVAIGHICLLGFRAPALEIESKGGSCANTYIS